MAVRWLKSKGVEFEPFEYQYEEKGGTRQTARELNVDEHSVIKTLVMDPGSGDPFIVLMHGDMEVSLKELSRVLGIKKVEPCEAKKAFNATGYQFGGTSPFGTRRPLKIYAEHSIFDLPEIYINGGKHGFIVKFSSADLANILEPEKVNVAVPH